MAAHGRAQFENRQGVERAVRYVGTLQDMTDRHAEDHHNLELASRRKLALNASCMAVWEVDLATETVVGSPDLNRLFGLPADSKSYMTTWGATSN